VKKESVYDETMTTTAISPFVAMTPGELVKVLLYGIGVGVVTAAAVLLLNQFVFGAVLCRPQSVAECSQAPNYAMIVGSIVGAIAGLVMLARLRVYRPLLVVLAATIALWGMHGIVASTAWYWVVAIFAVLFGLSYALFAWIARIRNFVMALVVTIVVVVVVRFLLVA